MGAEGADQKFSVDFTLLALLRRLTFVKRQTYSKAQRRTGSIPVSAFRLRHLSVVVLSTTPFSVTFRFSTTM